MAFVFQESAPQAGPMRNKVSHSDTAHTSPQSSTHDHNSRTQPSLLADYLNADRQTDSRPMSNTSKATQETSISRATSRPTTGAAVNVEISEYDESDESPSFRGRMPAVRFDLPAIDTRGKEKGGTGGSPKDKTQKKKKKKTNDF